MARKTQPDPEGPRLIGYARVSTAEQSLDMQIDALKQAGVHPDNIHVEHVSGVAARRRKLELALKDCRRGDTFVVWKLDRLGRSALDLHRKLRHFEEEGIQFRSLTDKIDTTSAMGNFVFAMLAAFAQFERDLIVERTRAGIKAHIERGGKIGQPPKMTPEKIKEAEKMIREGRRIEDIARYLQVSTGTMYNYFDGPTISALRGPRPKNERKK